VVYNNAQGQRAVCPSSRPSLTWRLYVKLVVRHFPWTSEEDSHRLQNLIPAYFSTTKNRRSTCDHSLGKSSSSLSKLLGNQARTTYRLMSAYATKDGQAH